MDPYYDTTAYCTVDMVKAHGVDTTQYSDEEIEFAITLVTAYIDAFYYLNLEEQLGEMFTNSQDEWQHFVRYNDKTKVFSGEGHYVLPLYGSRLIELKEITENGYTVPLDYVQVTPRSLYKYTNTCNVQYVCGLPGKWIRGKRNVYIKGDWGFPGIPRTIHMAASRLVVMYLEGKAGDGIASFSSTVASTFDSTSGSTSSDIKSFRLDDISVSFDSGTVNTTRFTKNAIQASVESGLYLQEKTTGDPWCDSILRQYKYKSIRARTL